MATRDETDINSEFTADTSAPSIEGFEVAPLTGTPMEPEAHSAFAHSAIGEPSFADAIAWIGADADLDKSTRIHWATSLRRMADFLGRPPECIPARLTSVRQPINRLNAASLGVAPKTFANHKSNVRAALTHLRNKGLTPPRGTPLLTAWASLVDAVPLKHFRITLMTFARYCSGGGTSPADVTVDTVHAYFAHREQTTFLEVGLCRRRDLARAWNHARATVEGWPDSVLDEEPLPAASAGPKWEDFPDQLREEIDCHLDGLRRLRRGPTGKRLRPCKSSTIALRRRELAAYARKAVACGHAIDDLRTLRDLLLPDTVKGVLEAYWPDETTDPGVYVISLSWRLYAIAREVGCLTEAELASLDEIQSSLASFHRNGLTPKNMAVVRQVVTTDAWSRVIRLPDALLAQARARRNQSPVRAAVLAGVAVAIRLLVVAPVRIGNLSAIRLDDNLIRPGGPGTPLTLIFVDHDTKNRVPLEFPLDKAPTALIDEYVHTFRPALMRGHNSDWLFPSENGGHKRPSTLSVQICNQVERHVGFAVTAHQFRHAAAAIILKAKPGNYELARRVLGHRSIQTTINFYIGLESVDAARTFGRLVAQELADRSDGTDDED
jgi:integrase